MLLRLFGGLPSWAKPVETSMFGKSLLCDLLVLLEWMKCRLKRFWKIMIPLNRVLFIVNHCAVMATWGHAQSRGRGHLCLQLSPTCSVLSGGR